MSDRRVIYLTSATPHMHYLVTSIVSLRKIWNGPVIVYAYPESLELVQRVAADDRLSIEARLCEPELRPKKNGQFLQKIKLMQTLDPGVNMYLDCDTLPVKRHTLDRLFRMGECGFCPTQFCGYQSNGNIVGKRVERLIGREGIPQEYVEEALKNSYPSPNGGVFACRPESPVLPLWEEWTSKILDIFIADETALHAIVVKHIMENRFDIFDMAVGGKFNCSPSKKQNDLPNNEVGIWHGHGHSFNRPGKSPLGVWLWWPIYQRCLKENLGGIAEWKDQVASIGRRANKSSFLAKLEGQPDDACRYCGTLKDDPLRQGLGGHVKSCPAKVKR